MRRSEELADGGDSSSDDEAGRTLIDQETPDVRAARREQIRRKILAVGRMQRMFQDLRYVTTPLGGHILTGSQTVKDRRMPRNST
jgi:hypothetical protein